MNKNSIRFKNLYTLAGKIILASALLFTSPLSAQTLCPNVNSVSFTQQAGFGSLNKIIIGGANNNDGAICWNCYTDSSMIGYGYGYARAYNMANSSVPHSATLPFFSSRIWQDPLKSVFRIENGQGICNDSVTWNKGISLHLNGSVGIGTDNTFGYKLAVNGAIVAKNDIRTTQLGVAWPDYVFAPSYRLTPLLLLEKEIDSLGHLPGMPTALEVDTHGISLPQVSVQLVKKVEELTLYTIEQQKQIDELKRLVARLLKEKE